MKEYCILMFMTIGLWSCREKVKNQSKSVLISCACEDRVLVIDTTENGDTIHSKLHIDPHYPGDWRKFVRENLRADIGRKNGAPVGTHIVMVKILVDTFGKVTNIKPMTKRGYGMEEEAVRVIKLSGKWIPGILNGKKVFAYRKQPFMFHVLEK